MKIGSGGTARTRLTLRSKGRCAIKPRSVPELGRYVFKLEKMTANPEKNWKAIIGLISELKRCDERNITTASVAMAFICIDTLANLARPANKKKVTRNDFIGWVNLHLHGIPAEFRGHLNSGDIIPNEETRGIPEWH